MSDSLRLRVERLERLLDQRSRHYDSPDFAAAWAELDRVATFFMTLWRVAVVSGVTPAYLGFPGPDGFALPPGTSLCRWPTVERVPGVQLGRPGRSTIG